MTDLLAVMFAIGIAHCIYGGTNFQVLTPDATP